MVGTFYSFKKKGSVLRDDRRIGEFQRVLRDFQLEDLGFKGPSFTCEMGNFEHNNIMERLDRVVMNFAWRVKFPNFVVCHLPHSFVDHCPLLLVIDKGEGNIQSNHFRFEASWTLEDSCEAKVRKLWEQSRGTLPHRLELLGHGLESWADRLRKEKGRR